MQDFRVLSLNIHKGFAMGNRRFTLEKIRECLRESGSNIVFLQEVSGENVGHRRKINGWPETNQFEFLADSVWSHYAYGKNAIYQQGHHGNAILSEIPFSQWRNVDVSHITVSQRGILHGELENGLHLLCVHFGLLERERKKQVRQLQDYIQNEIPADKPLILAGDFNDWRRSAHRQLQASLKLVEANEQHEDRLANTFPAMLPCLPMDRIYLRGFKVTHCRVMREPSWRTISDHCAIVSEIRLQD